MTQLLAILTAFGLGSIVTAVIQAWLSRGQRMDDRRFDEKKAAYVGLLEAYHRAAVEHSDENSKLFAYWQMRCELVASAAVRDAVCRIVETNDDRSGRELADRDMKNAMRRDLGITD